MGFGYRVGVVGIPSLGEDVVILPHTDYASLELEVTHNVTRSLRTLVDMRQAGVGRGRFIFKTSALYPSHAIPRSGRPDFCKSLTT
jgi:hypothetical protein